MFKFSLDSGPIFVIWEPPYPLHWTDLQATELKIYFCGFWYIVNYLDEIPVYHSIRQCITFNIYWVDVDKAIRLDEVLHFNEIPKKRSIIIGVVYLNGTVLNCQILL